MDIPGDDDSVLDHSEEVPEPVGTEVGAESPILKALSAISDLVPMIAKGNTSLVPLIMGYFTELANTGIEDLYAIMGIPITGDHHIQMPLRFEKHIPPPTHQTRIILQCAQDLRIGGNTGSALPTCIRICLRETIYNLLDRLDEITHQIIDDNFENFEELTDICNELTSLCTDDIAPAVGLTPDEVLGLRSALHDSRVIIGNIQGFATLINDPKSTTEKKSRRQGFLKDQFLALRSTRHVLEEFFDPTVPSSESLNKLVASLRKATDRMMSDKNLEDYELIFETDPTLDGAEIMVNRTHFMEAFKNLFRNSYDAKCPDQPCVIRVRIVPDYTLNGFVTFIVEDNGPGFSDEKLDEVQRLLHFKVYGIEQRRELMSSGPLKKTFGGKGVGLKGTLRNIQNMGGFIGGLEPRGDIDEGDLGGAIFRIYLRKSVFVG